MARHRSPGGRGCSPALDEAHAVAIKRAPGAHRIPTPSSALRGKVVVAAVAAGAFAAAAAGQSLAATADSDSDHTVTPLADGNIANAALGTGGGSGLTARPVVLGADGDGTAEARKLAETTQVTAERQAREAEAARAAAAEAARKAREAREAREAAAREAERAEQAAEQPQQPQVAAGGTVAPAQGTFTSGFGARWGASHMGIDIANSLGTPIVAASGGTVIEAGPASGFGNWVRIQLDDGTVHVYGHMAVYDVSAGQRVEAGEKIAEIGNEGQSTGPHVHFEVWQNGGEKVDPQAWLAERGVQL
ncbi:M23 family metallopeptidase [Tamaricihabitans halophyticus]|uniref:M23 family metallopeptidase n=1 Tax=Tamaricihabitans halophyticus TaxID=1262583 RepID=UPI0010437BCB